MNRMKLHLHMGCMTLALVILPMRHTSRRSLVGRGDVHDEPSDER